LLTLGAAERPRPFTSPTPDAPERGHGLAPGEPEQGWISLFDGATAFGWTGGRVEAVSQNAALLGDATTTSEFGDYELRVDAASGIWRVDRV
jgi:hypothetical protein